MPPLDFPSSPTNGQYHAGYIWNDASGVWDSAYAPRAATIPLAGTNYVINGAFDIWQRGTAIGALGSGATNFYSADRWESYRSGYAAGMSAYRVDSDLTGFRYFARVYRDSGNTGTQALYFNNPFETSMIAPLRDKTVTVSFYVRKGANYSAASDVLLFQADSGTGTESGTRNGFTSQTTVATQNVTLTSSWQRVTKSFVVPANSTQFALRFIHTPTGTAGAGDYFDIAGVQLEEGAAATDFRRNAPSIQAELAACQRYYQVGAAGFGGYQTINAAIDCLVMFPVVMRATPSDTWSFTNTSNMRAGSNRWITAYGVQRAALLNSTGSGVAWDEFKMSAEL